MAMAEKVPGWLERILLPQISEIKGEIKLVNVRIDGLDQKLSERIDGLQGRIEVEFKMVHTEIKRLDERIDSLDRRTDLTQRLATVEEQVRELRAKA
jgi:hypothetical protein